MGVSEFTKVFAPHSEVDIKKAVGNYAIDAYLELFKSTTVVNPKQTLTNPKGEPTMHIVVCINNIVRRKIGKCDDIWCLDSRDPRETKDPKQRVIAERVSTRIANLEEIKKAQAELDTYAAYEAKTPKARLLAVDPNFYKHLEEKRERIRILKARNPDARQFTRIVEDVIFILTKLGVRMTIAPVGIDAEHLAAQINREGRVDCVMSTDTDTMAYGAICQLKKIPKKTGKYSMYTLAHCLAQHALTYEQFVQVCTTLGTDFNVKTKGIGPKTVIQAVKNKTITFTDEQKAAQAKFADRTPIIYTVTSTDCTKSSIEELKEWLVTEQGFSKDRTDKLLEPLLKML